MSSLLITNGRRYDAPQHSPVCSIFCRDGVIQAAGPADRADRVLDAGGRIVAPGFIEVHIQGAGGADVLDATPEALEAMSRTCARFGVTSFLGTTVYKPGKDNRHLQVAAECVGRDLGGARLLGIHLEGPFISSQKRGMIQPDCLTSPAAAILDDIYALTGDTLKMMTVAPELPASAEAIRTLVDNGAVASFGHSKATYDETLRGFDMGITHVTHLFNAMASLHHRDPGPLAAIFERPDITCQVITDGVHIHPSVLRLAFDALGPERFVTITDGMHSMGLPDGHYIYNQLEYESKEGTARYKDGTLIGTALGLSQMLARLTQFTPCTVPDAIKTVTENAAQVLGQGQTKGSLAPGQDADLVILESDLSVHTTIVAGRVVYQR